MLKSCQGRKHQSAFSENSWNSEKTNHKEKKQDFGNHSSGGAVLELDMAWAYWRGPFTLLLVIARFCGFEAVCSRHSILYKKRREIPSFLSVHNSKKRIEKYSFLCVHVNRFCESLLYCFQKHSLLAFTQFFSVFEKLRFWCRFSACQCKHFYKNEGRKWIYLILLMMPS